MKPSCSNAIPVAVGSPTRGSRKCTLSTRQPVGESRLKSIATSPSRGLIISEVLRVVVALLALAACTSNAPQELRVPGEQSTRLTAVSPAVPPGKAGGYIRPPTGKRVIVFVNGIFGDAISTWQHSGGAYWPDLIAKDPDFDGVDIYVHSFESPKIARAQQIQDLASRLKDYLLTDRVLDHDEVVFISHSMGGLVTRAFLISQGSRPQRTPMLFFFATPTAGADVAAIAQHLSENPQLRDMQPLSNGGYVKTLREEWLRTSNNPLLNYPNAIASFCAYEILEVWHVKIVSELSATYLCNRENRAVRANHIEIVKPNGLSGEPYVFFKAAYLRTFGPAASRLAMAMARATVRSDTDNQAAIHITSTAFEELFLKRVKGKGAYVEVACGEEKSGDLIAHVDLEPGERIVDVRPSLVNTVNLKSSSVALIRHARGYAVLRYVLRGVDMAPSKCPGHGRAEIITYFVLAGVPSDGSLRDYR